jgi:prepilin-type N-terminal cleavage/methylation domain-containing protein
MKRAFTLIELLVVIAIIAILAAILFPVFAQAKSAAKKTQSLSNVKNLGLAVQMYTIDSDDVLPQLQYSKSNTEWVGTPWQEMIYPYVKNGSTYNDATYGTRSNGNGGIFDSPSNPAPKQTGGSYAMHQDLGRDGAAPWNGWAVPKTFSTTGIDNIADKIYLIERGVNKGAGNWLQFAAWEWDWIDYLAPDSSGQPTHQPEYHASIAKGKGDCDYAYDANDWTSSYDGSSWAGCGMLPRYRYTLSTPMVMLDGHARSFSRTEKSTNIVWFKNIYIPEAFQFGSPY